MFLRNAWYAAAWDTEVKQALHATTLLGEPVVLYRKADGAVVALEDACPHRKLPLSMGRLQGDTVECGYHGLTFDDAGTCVKAACVSRIPQAAKVRSYPVHERYGLVWLWMGDPALADRTKLLEIPEWDDPAWGLNRGDSMTIDCNYLYMTDNLLDPSHVAWVHQSSFGIAACESEPLQTQVNDDGVVVSRWLHDIDAAPFYRQYLKFEGRCDRLQYYEVRYPAHAIIKGVHTPAGSGGDGAPVHEKAFLMDSYNFMTPVDENRTRYYWFQLRNFDADDAQVSRQFAADVRHAFEEDRVVLSAVHAGMKQRQSPNIDLAIDAGPMRFRRGMERLIREEQQAALGLLDAVEVDSHA
ncbi:aromatic ring-hydroxylating dioxygenase subunit alpha [Pseudomonas guariconensis]|uniref:aromatic ring-hydroxylating dioxygenase subunit alpha n=1 Tax=Pseudomonas guariconensis TaxID=1288410 RepID=UPI0018A9458C|nr:aromatic ring-hydroxylating dioxygenase subunit alpha [Pseudomonas guariconensis]MBF8758112.1 aromatic ring-hydroxylating dioxygenase subunit alpha [Pseudomonas guariconensis]